MKRRMLTIAELKEMLEPVNGFQLEFFLHTIYNQHDYAGAFDTWGNLQGLCDEPYKASLYTDDPDYAMDEVPENIRKDMDYIQDHADELYWWFVDADDQIEELQWHIDKLQEVVNNLNDYMQESAE